MPTIQRSTTSSSLVTSKIKRDNSLIENVIIVDSFCAFYPFFGISSDFIDSSNESSPFMLLNEKLLT